MCVVFIKELMYCTHHKKYRNLKAILFNLELLFHLVLLLKLVSMLDVGVLILAF